MPNGTTRWSSQAANLTRKDATIAIDVEIKFPQYEWEQMKSVYGWAALQYQAWARGSITVNAQVTQDFALYTPGLIEYCIDNECSFGGDCFGARRAPQILHLRPGPHQIDVRVVRDVRSLGGVGEPIVVVHVELEILQHRIAASQEHLLIADVVDGRLASPWASVPIRNHGSSAIDILEVSSEDEAVIAKLHFKSAHTQSVSIMPGQTRPIVFSLTVENVPSTFMAISIVYRCMDRNESSIITVTHQWRFRELSEFQKVTFLHPGDIVSYAMLRPPPLSLRVSNNSSVPIMLHLHGAGVEADAGWVTGLFDDVSDLPAWTLIPSGVTTWSSDDWHKWGWADVESAIAAIPDWIEAVGWHGFGVDLDRWLVSGHSNGGHGTWYALTHHPDRIIAAVPASAYMSTSAYVPYQFWHETDPRKVAVVQSAMNSYRPELLLSNVEGVSILVQHGSADDNVPPYHARRMSQLLHEAGLSSDYHEFPGKPHVWDGMMTTNPLQAFYRKHLTSGEALRRAKKSFELTVATPTDVGTINGVQICRQYDPGQLNKIKISLGKSGTYLETSNVINFELSDPALWQESLVVEGQTMKIPSASASRLLLTQELNQSWTISNQYKSNPTCFVERRKPIERTGKQLGALDSILSSQGRFIIVCPDERAMAVALQISRNLNNYFAADAEIVGASFDISSVTGNIIIVGLGGQIPAATIPHPIQVHETHVSLKGDNGREWIYGVGDSGLGAIFLRPVADHFDEDRLELVVWGVDLESLAVAARLVPMQTGVGQPDFIIMTKEMLWKGIDGVLAMGFFNYLWEITKSSYPWELL